MAFYPLESGTVSACRGTGDPCSGDESGYRGSQALQPDRLQIIPSCLTAERAVLEMLQAGCHAPVAVYANLFEEDGETKLRLRGINGPEHASQLTDGA